MTRKYHKHQVTEKDGVYYHLLNNIHRSQFGKDEHNKEIEQYKKDMKEWTESRKNVEEKSGKVTKYRNKIYIYGVSSLVGLLAIIMLLPGVSVSGLNDVYCGELCEIPFSICTWKYDLNFKENTQPFYFEGNAILLGIRDSNGKPFTFTNNKLPIGQCWNNLTALVHKNAFDTIKYGFEIGDVKIDPYLFGGKLSVNKTLVDNDITHFSVKFNLSSAIDYLIDDLDKFKTTSKLHLGKYNITGLNIRIKKPAYVVNDTKKYQCSSPNWIVSDSDHFWCYENYTYMSVANGSWITYHTITEDIIESRLKFEHEYEYFDPVTSTFYWNESRLEGGNYVKFNPLGKTIQANKTYELELYATKKAELGSSAIDFNVKFANNSLNLTWWNTSWNYKVPINIDQTRYSTISNVLVNVTYDLASLISTNKLDGNGYCLRFVNSTETGELNYRYENRTDNAYGVNGTSGTHIILEVDEIPSTNTTIYMYYDLNCADAMPGESNFTNFAGTGGVIWLMGENGGTTTYDSSGYDHVGTFAGDPSWYSNAPLGYGIEFDGTGDYFTGSGSALGANGITDVSMGLWINTNSSVNNDRVFIYSIAFVGEIALYIKNTDKISWQMYDGVSTYSAASTSDVNDGNWHFVVGTFDGNFMRIYFDGISEANTSASTNVDLPSSPTFFSIAGEVTPLDTDMIADFAFIVNRTLSQDEIMRLYQQNLIEFGDEESATGDNNPVTSLNTPADKAIGTGTTNYTFNCSATDDNDIDNITLRIYNYTGNLNYSNATVFGGSSDTYASISENISLTEGNWTWNCLAYDNASQQDTDTTRHIRVKTDNTYYKNISVENLAINISEYQYELNINLSTEYLSGKIEHGCPNVYFLNSTENYTYCIESCSIGGGNNATFIILIPFLENNTNTTIEMRYGNVTSLDSGCSDIYIYYDDFTPKYINWSDNFDDGSIDWNSWWSQDPDQYVEGNLTETGGILVQYAGNTDASCFHLRHAATTNLTAENTTGEADVKSGPNREVLGYQIKYDLVADGTIGGVTFDLIDADKTLYAVTRNATGAGNTNVATNISEGVNVSVWNTYSIVFNQTQSWYYVNDDLNATHTTHLPLDSNKMHIHISAMTEGEEVYQYIDNVSLTNFYTGWNESWEWHPEAPLMNMIYGTQVYWAPNLANVYLKSENNQAVGLFLANKTQTINESGIRLEADIDVADSTAMEIWLIKNQSADGVYSDNTFFPPKENGMRIENGWSYDFHNGTDWTNNIGSAVEPTAMDLRIDQNGGVWFYNDGVLKGNQSNALNTSLSYMPYFLADNGEFSVDNLKLSKFIYPVPLFYLSAEGEVEEEPEGEITLFLNESSLDRFYELGYQANLYANSTEPTDTVCLDIDTPDHGDNFVCDTGTVEYNLTTFSFVDEFNDSTTEKNLTENITIFINFNNESDSIISAKWNITGIYDGIENNTELSAYNSSANVTTPTNAWDEIWSTRAQVSCTTTPGSPCVKSGNIYQNYTITGNPNEVKIKIKAGQYYYATGGGWSSAQDMILYVYNWDSETWEQIAHGTELYPSCTNGDTTCQKNTTWTVSTTNRIQNGIFRTMHYITVSVSGGSSGSHTRRIEDYEESIQHLFYPENIKIDIENDETIDVILSGYINNATGYITKLNSSNTVENLTWGNSTIYGSANQDQHGGFQIKYINVSKNTAVSSAYLNLTGYRMDAQDDNTSFFLPGAITYITGMTTIDGVNFYSANWGQDGNIYKFNNTGGLLNTYDVSANCELTYGVWCNTSNCWTTCGNTSRAWIAKFDTSFNYQAKWFIYPETSYRYPYGLSSPDNGETFLIIDRRYVTTRTRLGNFSNSFSLLDNCKINDSGDNYFTDVHAYGDYAWIATYDRPIQRFKLSDIKNCDAGETEIYPDNYFYKNNLLGGSTGKTTCRASGITGNDSYIWCGDWAYDQIYRFYKPYPTDVKIDSGGTGYNDYNGSGELSTETQIDLNITTIQNYVDSCETNICEMPFYIGVKSLGIVQVSDINITYNFNPIDLNVSVMNLSDSVNVPFNVTSESWGSINITGIDFRYNGSKNITVTANQQGNESNNDTQLVMVIWSNYSKVYPFPILKHILFTPRQNNSKNVTPLGQTSSTPILNITGLAYEEGFRFGAMYNLSQDCINITFSNTSSKDNGIVLSNITVRTIYSLGSPNGNFGLWAWADFYGCNASIIGRVQQMNYTYKSCCTSCLSCW